MWEFLLNLCHSRVNCVNTFQHGGSTPCSGEQCPRQLDCHRIHGTWHLRQGPQAQPKILDQGHNRSSSPEQCLDLGSFLGALDTRLQIWVSGHVPVRFYTYLYVFCTPFVRFPYGPIWVNTGVQLLEIRACLGLYGCVWGNTVGIRCYTGKYGRDTGAIRENTVEIRVPEVQNLPKLAKTFKKASVAPDFFG